MKFDQQKSFGHPVCQSHSDDYVNCDFEVSVGLTNAKGKYDFLLSFEAAIGVPELQSLLADHKAKLVLIVNCRDTLTRQYLETSTLSGEFELPGDKARGWIEIYPFLISKVEGEVFRSDLINEEFGKQEFVLHDGMVLAQAEPIGYNVNRTVFQRITSIFTFTSSPDIELGKWAYSLDQDNILVMFAPADYSAVMQAQNERGNQIILLNSVFLPILGDIFARIRREEDGEEFLERQWYGTIINRLHEQDLDIDSNVPDYDLAQEALGMPLSNLLSGVFAK